MPGANAFLLICDDVAEGEKKVGLIILNEEVDLVFGLCSEFVAISVVEG